MNLHLGNCGATVLLSLPLLLLLCHSIFFQLCIRRLSNGFQCIKNYFSSNSLQRVRCEDNIPNRGWESREGRGGASKYLNGQKTREGERCNWDGEIYSYFYDDDDDDDNSRWWCFKLKLQKSFEQNLKLFLRKDMKWRSEKRRERRHDYERVNKLQMQTRHAS